MSVMIQGNNSLFFSFQHLVDHITSEELKPKEILQSSFDLLGELMKFNQFAFIRFDQAISTKQVSKLVINFDKWKQFFY